MKLKRHEYLQLVGLLALAPVHVKALRDIEAAICKIVGEKPNEGGHSMDAVYSEYSAEELIEKVDARRKHDAKVAKSK